MASAAEPQIGDIFRAFTAFHRTAALKAAVELDLFSRIGSGADTVAALAAATGAAERGVRILGDFLTVDGFLAKHEGRYALAPSAAAFLDRASPGYIGSAVAFVASPWMMRAMADVTGAVRRGGTVVEEEATTPEHPMWVDFARAMAPLARVSATLLATLLDAEHAPAWKVLDVAAGHGLYGIALATANRGAEVVALDWPNVLAVAREHAQAAGVAERVRTIAGSAFDADWGGDYDLVLLTNFLHHFDPSGCEALLRKAHAALKPGGRVLALEFVPDPERVSPPEPAAFALVMLVATPGGDAYTFAEYQRMFARAGFRDAELRALPPTFHHVVIARK